MSNIFFTEKDGKFTIPIPEEGFTTNDENSEFTDGFFVSWTYPLTLFFNNELKRILGDLSDPNVSRGKWEIAGFLTKYGEVFPSKMKISMKGLEGKVNFEFGVASLDVMDKKLAELDLGTIVTGNLYDYIDVNLYARYPYTPVCFPRIRTPENYLETVSSLYGGYGIFNETDRSDGLVYRNEFTQNGQAIFNFIKPIVYVTHILVKGFENAGYALAGDILEDEDLKYIGFNHNNTADVELVQEAKQVVYNYGQLGFGFTSGSFDIIGSYRFSLIVDNGNIWITMRVKNVTTGQTLYEASKNGYDYNHPDYNEYTYALPVFTQTTKIRVELTLHNNPGSQIAPDYIFTAYLNPVGGTERKAFYLPDELVLNKYVPDVTFLEVVKSVKALKNYSFLLENNVILMNRIKNTLPDKVQDFTFSEQKDVDIEGNTMKGYIFKFAAPDEFNFLQYQYGKNGLIKAEKKIDAPDYEERELLAYPMPLTTNFYEKAADQVSAEVQGLPMVGYDGEGFRNHPLDLSYLNIPDIYENNYKNSLLGRLTASVFRWAFFTTSPLATYLKSADCIYAYGAFHKIRSILKKHHLCNVTEVEIETENRY